MLIVPKMLALFLNAYAYLLFSKHNLPTPNGMLTSKQSEQTEGTSELSCMERRAKFTHSLLAHIQMLYETISIARFLWSN